MARRQKTMEENPQHIHRWIRNRDDALPYCDQPYKSGNCHALRVSARQLAEIEDEWNNYYDLIKTTPAYLDYQAMRVAWKEKNQPLMAEINARVINRNKISSNEYGEEVLEPKERLLKPNFPDPMMTQALYIIAEQA